MGLANIIQEIQNAVTFSGGGSSIQSSNYVEIDEDNYVLSHNEGNVMSRESVKIVEFSKNEQISTIKDELISGNILIVDSTPICNDDFMQERMLRELNRFVNDINGDIVGAFGNLLIVTPSNVSIDRERLTASSV
jgi:hypothetical protein